MGAKVFGVGRKIEINYLIPLIEQATGSLRVLVDGAGITTFRTAATSAAAMQMLAPDEEVTLGIIGSGQEAQAHARAMVAIRDVKSAKIYSPTQASRERFAEEFEAESGVKCVAVSNPAEAASAGSVVIAAARSRDESPILMGDWLENAKAIISVGSTLPEQREIDTSVVERADLIICDVPEEVMVDTGDMIAARERGVEFEDKCFSLNDLLCGKLESELKAAKLPMFKSVGSGIQDIVCAELAFDRAEQAGLLVDLPIEFYMKT